jgi:hypothetical protein
MALDRLSPFLKEHTTMRTLFAIAASVLLYFALPAGTALACEGCVMASETMPTDVACIESPDGPGEICTAGGGYCYEEGRCRIHITGDGSLLPADVTGQFASTAGEAGPVVRRACDNGIVARSYAPGAAERLREKASSLTI